MISDKFPVIVVGCGASGMAAADLLQSQGVSVKVLEGRDRVGGRINASHELGFMVDLGASFIHGHQGNAIFELAKKLNEPMVQFNYKDTIIVVDGYKQDTEKVLSQFEKFRDLIGEASKEADPGMSVRDLANKIIEIERLEGEQKTIFELFILCEIEQEFAGSIDRLSAAEFGETLKLGANGDDYILPLGYSHLFESIASNLNDVTLSCQVAQIDQSNDKEVIVKCTNGEIYKTDYLICTLPLGVLQSGIVEFLPPLVKTESIKKMGFATFDKLIMVFDKPFWPENQCFYVGEEKEGDYAFIVNLHKTWEVPALKFFISESIRKKYRNEVEIVDYGLRLLRASFPEAQINLEKHIVTNWGAETFTRGSYSCFVKGSGEEDVIANGNPEGRVMFAGEHTYKPDLFTVNGAWNSGLVAARTVLNKLSQA